MNAPHPSRSNLDRIVATSLEPVSLGLAAYCVMQALSRAVGLAPWSLPLFAIDGLSALALAWAGFIFRTRTAPLRMAHPAGVAIVAIMLLDQALPDTKAPWLMGTPWSVLMLLGTGFLFLSYRWTLASYALVASAWAGFALPREGLRPEAPTALALAMALGLGVQTLRLRFIRKESRSRLQQEEELRQRTAALSDSSRTLSMLAEKAGDIFYRYRLVPALTLEYINPVVTEVLGYKPEEMTADPYLIYKAVLPEDAPKLEALRPNDGIKGPVTTRYRHKDGHIVWVEQWVIPIFDEAGRLVALEGLSRNVTGRYSAEAALALAGHRLQSALRSAQIGVFDWDLSTGRVSYQNCESLLGLTADAMPRHFDGALALIHPEDQERIRRAILHAVAGGCGYDVEFRINVPSLGLRWFTSRGNVSPGPDGKPTHLSGHLQDVTSRKLTEIALMESEERLRLALEASNMVIWDWDVRSGKTERIGNLKGLYGRTAQEMDNQENFYDNIHPDDAERIRGAIKTALERDGLYQEELRFLWPDGSVHWLETTGRVWRDQAGKPYRMMGYAISLAKRKEQENVLRAAFERAEEANKVKTTIFANMSHEIRTPMTAILGYSDLLAKKLRGTSLERYAQTIYRGGSRLLHLLNSIVDLARIEAGKTALTPTRFPLHESTERVVNLLRVLAEQKSLPLRVVPAEPLEVYTDAHALDQVLTNIIGNAIRFTEQGSVEIEATKGVWKAGAHPMAIVRVTDTGIGISDKFIAYVFDEFRQESEGLSRTHEGSGLGLSITKKLLERMGGGISLQSRKGEGTTVTIAIPLAPAADVPPLVGETREFDEPAPRPSSILVIEDDTATGELLRQLLGEPNVTWCTAGEEALAARQDKQFDLALVDIHLKGGKLDGLETLKRLREHTDFARVPAIALTAYAMTGDREQFLAYGFQDYLAKPFSQADLLRVVNRYLEGV